MLERLFNLCGASVSVQVVSKESAESKVVDQAWDTFSLVVADHALIGLFPGANKGIWVLVVDEDEKLDDTAGVLAVLRRPFSSDAIKRLTSEVMFEV